MIDSDQRLTAWLPKLRKAEWVSVDTEADSLHAYPEKLCLLQIACGEEEHLIDPLAGIDLQPLWKSLAEQELILHGADYDLRLLRRAGGFIPSKIFDTMLAARILGCGQFGLTDLVFRFLGVKLEKGPQKANWARRPLTPRMEAYARNDVKYLRPLGERLREQLKEKGRLTWHQESCDCLITECATLRHIDPDLVWRVKGSNRLNPVALSVLREIWHWREREAIEVNKPPFFILTPPVMLALASAAAEGAAVDPLLPQRFSTRRRQGLHHAIRHALEHPTPAHVLRRTSRPPSEAEKRRFRELEILRNQRAHSLGIDPTLIASRATLMGLARDWEQQAGELMVWQRGLLEPVSPP